MWALMDASFPLKSFYDFYNDKCLRLFAHHVCCVVFFRYIRHSILFGLYPSFSFSMFVALINSGGALSFDSMFCRPTSNPYVIFFCHGLHIPGRIGDNSCEYYCGSVLNVPLGAPRIFFRYLLVAHLTLFQYRYSTFVFSYCLTTSTFFFVFISCFCCCSCRCLRNPLTRVARKNSEFVFLLFLV